MSELDSHAREMRADSSTQPAASTLREGLPPTYRMRADAHYVESLDAEAFAPAIRYLDAETIESAGDEAVPAADFVESIRKHGVLQPLLVRGRGGRYRVISGRKRLAAAVATGLRRVPCVVQRADDDEARRLALATNLPSDTSIGLPLSKTSHADAVLADLSASLSALVSSVNLWSDGGALSQAVATDLIRAEAARAMRLLWAVRTLRDDVAITPVDVRLDDVLQQTRQVVASEQRLRRIDISVVVQSPRDVCLRGDRAQLADALAALVSASWILFEMVSGSRLLLRAVVRRDGYVTVEACREAFTVDECLLTGAFDRPWPVGSGPSALALLQAARKIAMLHGGHASASTGPAGTSVAIMLPVLG